MTQLRYGVIGTGMMGVEHLHNLRHIDGAVVTAIADPHPPSRDEASAAAPTAETFADHRALLDAGLCDAVVVASPNMTHLDVMTDVLATDLHVLVEKPLGIDVAQCRRMIELDGGRGGLTWVGLEYRYMAPVARLVAEVRGGAVGRPVMASIREHRFPFLSKVGDWNRFTANTGGTLVEKCCHFFDLMRLILDAEPTRVLASGGQDVNHLDESYGGATPDILDNAVVVVDFENGTRASLELCMFAEATRDQEQISVMGELGKVEALIPTDVVRIGRRGEHWIGDVEEHHCPPEAAFEGLHHGSSFEEHLRFRDAVLAGTEPEVSLHDGLASVAMGVAAHRSIDEGRAIPMDEVLRWAHPG